MRRQPYTRVEKFGQVRPAHVQRMGDVVFRVFQCLNSVCTRLIAVEDKAVEGAFDFTCPDCGFRFRSGHVHRQFDYAVIYRSDESVLEQGEFATSHDDHVHEAPRYKYCLLCYVLKPLEAFDHHSSRQSGRQGECRLCKQRYNDLKNQTRISDQHREAAQKRRLYITFSGQGRIDSQAIHAKFGGRCFNCDVDLGGLPARDRPLDHTLPARLLWPLTTDTATLLCRTCNGDKAEKWPGEFYDDAQLRRLAVLTGFDYALLSGPSRMNPEVVQRVRTPGFVDGMLAKFAPYRSEMLRLRNRVLDATGEDMFDYAMISRGWRDEADALRTP